MRRAGITILALTICLVLAGCGGEPSRTPASTTQAGEAENATLKISPGESSLPMQRTSRLKAFVTLADGYTEEISEYARWEYSDEAVAVVGTVDGNRGVVKGIASGSVVVAARFASMSATARITVTQDHQDSLGDNAKVVLLHHSVGASVWAGGVPEWFADHNARTGKGYSVTALEFPRKAPYGWSNNPYDYWNIWVGHAGARPYREEPTLEMLTQDYNVIVWKHSFTAGSILPDSGNAPGRPREKRLEHYKRQYNALKAKMRSFPKTRFIVWTGPAMVQGATDEAQAVLAREFVTWVKTVWDKPGDNIYLWDFYELQTEGSLFLKGEYAAGGLDSNLSPAFSRRVAPLFCKRVVDVIEGRGDTASALGE